VNTLKAGRGEVTVLVDKGATNCEVYSQSKGDYSVTYTSISNGVRNIDVLFNNLPVPGNSPKFFMQVLLVKVMTCQCKEKRTTLKKVKQCVAVFKQYYC